MCSNYIVYVNSGLCLDLFPENQPCKFTNKLSTPITLSKEVEYEMGVIGVTLPNEYYAVTPEDRDFTIHFKATLNQGLAPRSYGFTYVPAVGLLAGDMNRLTRALNTDVTEQLETFYGAYIRGVMRREGLFSWNDDLKRMSLTYVNAEVAKVEGIVSVTVKFSVRAARVLGFNTELTYAIYGSGAMRNHHSRISYLDDHSIDCVYLYSNIIQPSSLGDKTVNILDCFTLECAPSRGVHNAVYKPITVNAVDYIAIDVTNQKREDVKFITGKTVSCTLHIRPR